MARASLKRFYQELKRRKVIRVAIAYAIVAWLVIEVAATVLPELLLPEWSVRLIIVLAITWFPIALVLTRAFELTPDGLKIDPADSAQPETEIARKSRDDLRSDGRRSIAVIRILDQLFQEHGRPACLRSDHGAELISGAVQAWLEERHVKTHNIDPGSS